MGFRELAVLFAAGLVFTILFKVVTMITPTGLTALL